MAWMKASGRGCTPGVGGISAGGVAETGIDRIGVGTGPDDVAGGDLRDFLTVADAKPLLTKLPGRPLGLFRALQGADGAAGGQQWDEG